MKQKNKRFLDNDYLIIGLNWLINSSELLLIVWFYGFTVLCFFYVIVGCIVLWFYGFNICLTFVGDRWVVLGQLG